MGQIGPVYIPPHAQPAEVIPAIPAASVALVRPAYAGFWLRACAFAIDTFILSFFFATLASAYPTQLMTFPDQNTQSLLAIPHVTFTGFILLFVIMWAYYVFFETSSWQATPGKRLFRLYVTDLAGGKITLQRSSMRYFGRKISEVTFLVGYLIAAFTEKKQALHDIMAGCLVLRRR
ncbi:MAG: RDD family protein [Acidobacteriia bacterium]|nr:RDD family protein [Terriglobia bacterium]